MAEAFCTTVAAGARPAFAPGVRARRSRPWSSGGGFGPAEVELYGDVVPYFVSCRDAADAPFLPGFENVEVTRE
ncbi:hypothetical protein ACP4OV_020034 [Aristida adscensionis]